MSKLQGIVHPVKKEFRRKGCGFEHHTPDDFVKSQEQNKNYLQEPAIIIMLQPSLSPLKALTNPGQQKRHWALSQVCCETIIYCLTLSIFDDFSIINVTMKEREAKKWQTCTKSMTYLFYRWFMALFFVAVVIESMWPVKDDESSYWLYFIYMTNWGIWMCMLTNLLGAILVTIWHYHPEYADKLLNMNGCCSYFRIYWGMHIITLVLSIVVTIIYWSILYDANESVLDATNVLTHGFNSICMFIDLWIVAHPLRLLHMFLPVLFGVVYAIFSYIFQINGGINKKGKPYIYHVIDWSKPREAFITVLGVLVLSCCIYVLLFVFFKLRLFLHRVCRNNSFVLPTSNKKQPNGLDDKPSSNGIQHSPSHISMVLGNFTGYENQAYSPSGEMATVNKS